MTKQAGKKAVHKLIEDFEKNESQFMSKDFQETEARTRFIDPFFAALGWEMNQTDIAKKFWDVHREYSRRDNSATKKPDYAFRVKEGVKYREKFFVEDKAPHVDLTGSMPVFQAKRYAFSSHGKTPIAILTDFQTFRVFNGLEKPVFENPLQGLIKGFDLEYHEYLDKWDAIWDAFSKEAVAEGSIERLIGKVNRNVKSLDDEFLADISAWRELLARNVALRNKELTADHINEAVQRILDRLIFIRNLEDRGIESEEGLLFFTKAKEETYLHLIILFRKLGVEYNGQLFKEHFSETITVDDTVIKSIIKQLYPPLSPYAFEMIEPEILGRIYERFLGSKIRLTEGHQAKVEEKPEVRHTGGVYYTPEYIVDYIVENTVEVKIKDKSPEEIESVTICDPACGSGSFLLGAFNFLIEYHREWYAKANQEMQKKYRNDFYTNAENEIRLTHKKKTEILTNNIFGVDIDREAVEVAIMSLYLKLLDEGQTEFYLPDITENIKCGNSLIGTDFYAKSGFDLSSEEQKKANCFDWDGKDGFTKIFKNGGFNVVIGNPPYGASLIKAEKEYLENFKCYEYQVNSFILFIEKGLSLLRDNGILSFITPATFLAQHYFKKIRNYILNKQIEKIVVLNYKVFSEADTGDTAIFTIINNDQKEYSFQYKIINNKDALEKEDDFNLFAMNECLSNERYEIKKGNSDSLLQRIISFTMPLNSIATCIIGIKPYQKGKGYPKQTEKTVQNRVFDSDKKVDNNYKPYLIGKDIDRYSINYSNSRFIKYGKWLAEPRFTAPFEKEKIIVRQTSDVIRAVIDSKNYYNLNNIYNIELTGNQYNYKYLLGILNSSFMVYIYQKIVPEKGRVFAEVKKVNLDRLPIPSLDLSKKEDKIKHDALVSLVDKMLDLKQKEAAEKSEHLKTVITRKIEVVDKALDTAVYELYNLTSEEIKTVERKE